MLGVNLFWQRATHLQTAKWLLLQLFCG